MLADTMTYSQIIQKNIIYKSRDCSTTEYTELTKSHPSLHIYLQANIFKHKNTIFIPTGTLSNFLRIGGDKTLKCYIARLSGLGPCLLSQHSACRQISHQNQVKVCMFLIITN